MNYWRRLIMSGLAAAAAVVVVTTWLVFVAKEVVDYQTMINAFDTHSHMFQLKAGKKF